MKPIQTFSQSLHADGRTDGHILPILCSVCDASANKAVVMRYNILGFHAGVHLCVLP